MKLKDENKRLKIIEETIKIVSKYGIAGLKMAVVAKKVGISQSNIYVYFKSKKELLISTFFSISLIYQEVLASSNNEMPFKLKMKEYFYKTLDSKIKYSKELNFVKLFVLSPYFNEEIKNKFEESYSDLIGLITEGQNNMILKNNIDAYLVMASFDGLTDKAIEYENKHAIKITKEIKESLFQMFWDSVKQ